MEVGKDKGTVGMIRGEFDFVELHVSLQYSALCEPSLIRNLQILSRERESLLCTQN
jgi:hypothetical protein